MKKTIIILFIFVLLLTACAQSGTVPTATATETAAMTAKATEAAAMTATATETSIPSPTIESGKGRIVFDLETALQKVKVRYITDNFLIGVGVTAPGGCISADFLRKLRFDGINYFLPFTSWASIETVPGIYTGEPCPGDKFIDYAAQSGATLNGHCTLFLMNQPYLIPSYAYGQSYEKLKMMVEDFIKAVVRRYPQIGIWTLNEPIAQNAFGWSRQQIYDLFVAASQWVHEANPDAKVMVNMIPVSNTWSGLYYDPTQVMNDLLADGMKVDIIGIEYYYSFYSSLIGNRYPTMEEVKAVIDKFRIYNLPIIFSEVGVPGVINGKDNFEGQAQWLEDFFRLAHSDPDVIGATWYFVIDDQSFGAYYGLAKNDYSLRPAGNRLLMLADEWNPSTIYQMNDDNYLDLNPGKYDVQINDVVYPINVVAGQETTISSK